MTDKRKQLTSVIFILAFKIFKTTQAFLLAPRQTAPFSPLVWHRRKEAGKSPGLGVHPDPLTF